MAYSLITSLAAERSERLARLVYELLDAHADTERLIHERPDQLEWRIHLGYLRDLQRVGREILAESTDDAGAVDGRDRCGEPPRPHPTSDGAGRRRGSSPPFRARGTA